MKMRQPILTFPGIAAALVVAIICCTTTMLHAGVPSFQGIGDLPGGPGGGFASQADGVSADGSVVVGWSSSASGTEASVWTSDVGMVGLGDLPGGVFHSHASGVSADGSVVVGSSISASGFEAFRWTSAGGMVGLGDLPGGSFASQAFGVSADGSVVVGGGKSTSIFGEAFRWTSAGGMVGLGDLPGGGFLSQAFEVSADGSVVVGSSMPASGSWAFIWDPTNGMRNLHDVLSNLGLDLTGWTLTDVRGVSADGRTVVGLGSHPSGEPEGWIATLPAACPADVNGDGAINVLDLIDLLLCFGQPANPPCDTADINGDGATNVLDLIDLLLAFGTACP